MQAGAGARVRPGDTLSISLRRDSGLLPPCRQPRWDQLQDELPQRHHVQPRAEVLHPWLLHPLHTCPAR